VSIKALIWDLEGVLLKSRAGDLPAMVAQRLGVPSEKARPVFFSDMNDRVDLGEITQKEFNLHILDQLELPHSRLSDLESVFDNDLFVDQDLLARIREYRRNFKIGMISNFSDDLRKRLEDQWHIANVFDEMIISCEVGMVKPDPLIFQLMLDRLDCQPWEAVFIDDRPRNVEGSREFGLHTVFFKDRDEALAELDKIIRMESGREEK
jgi:putative hydrolase of the HAD superfamily